jgi:hypothetical protein
VFYKDLRINYRIPFNRLSSICFLPDSSENLRFIARDISCVARISASLTANSSLIHDRYRNPSDAVRSGTARHTWILFGKDRNLSTYPSSWASRSAVPRGLECSESELKFTKKLSRNLQFCLAICESQ